MVPDIAAILSQRHSYGDSRSFALSLLSRVSARVGIGVGRPVRLRIRGLASPVVVRLGTTDPFVLKEMFFDREYEPMLCHLPVKGARIVDLGTNIGLSVRVWLQHCPTARIVAVEPDGMNMQMAQQNLAQAGAQGQVQLVQTCVAGSSRMVTLDRGNGAAWSFKLAECTGPEVRAAEARDARAGAMKTVTISELLDASGFDGEIDLLKCDVEGAEAEIFAEAHGWIGRWRNLIVETHEPYTGEKLIADIARTGVAYRHTLLKKHGRCEVLMLNRL